MLLPLLMKTPSKTLLPLPLSPPVGPQFPVAQLQSRRLRRLSFASVTPRSRLSTPAGYRTPAVFLECCQRTSAPLSSLDRSASVARCSTRLHDRAHRALTCTHPCQSRGRSSANTVNYFLVVCESSGSAHRRSSEEINVTWIGIC